MQFFNFLIVGLLFLTSPVQAQENPLFSEWWKSHTGIFDNWKRLKDGVVEQRGRITGMDKLYYGHVTYKIIEDSGDQLILLVRLWSEGKNLDKYDPRQTFYLYNYRIVKGDERREGYEKQTRILAGYNGKIDDYHWMRVSSCELGNELDESLFYGFSYDDDPLVLQKKYQKLQESLTSENKGQRIDFCVFTPKGDIINGYTDKAGDFYTILKR